MRFGLNKRKRVEQERIKRLKRALGNRSIVLVGLMGAGKTVIGRRLARKLDLPFVDADHEIEAAAGMPVSDIFAEHGEEHFRQGERKVIARLLKNGPQILATGGGAFMNPKTRENIRQTGISLWLKADFDVLMERVMRRNTRPLLQTGNPEATMKRLIDERYPVYEHADVTVVSRDVPHDVVVSDAIAALGDSPLLDKTDGSEKS